MSKTTIFQARLREFEPVDGGGINLDVKSGRVRDDNTITDKADQTVALTDNATNFVEIDNVGAATANTSAFTAGSIPIATVVTASGDITSITDKRTWTILGGGGGGAALQVKVVNNARTAAAGSGTQGVTGVGFQPRAISIHAQGGNGTKTIGGWGFGDDVITTQSIFTSEPSGFFNRTSQLLSLTDGTNGMNAALTSMDSDGFTITWTKSGTGQNVEFIVLCFR